ncbi:MAG: hypothetical protein B6I20_14125 [Bacteroidetes bacterium 4572_117]|nr:MAG: hypothetical protein B6I20_14125 [Bacteroidetes bacterium 4572_117]
MRVLLIIVALFMFPNANASFYNNNVNSFFKMLYNYKFESADSILKIIETQNLDRGYISLLHVSFKWNKILSGCDDKSSIENCLEYTNRAIKQQLVSYNSKSTDGNYYLMFLYGYKARLSNLLGKEIYGAKYFFDGIKYLEKLDTSNSERKEFYNLAAGMYYCMIGYAYKSHPYLIIFSKYTHYADIQRGHDLLILGSNSKFSFIQVESLYFLVKIYSEVEKNNEMALNYNSKLLEKAPGNLLFNYYSIKILKSQGKILQAKQKMIDLRTFAKNNNELTHDQKEHFL